MYYKDIEEKLDCKTFDELLGKKYIIGKQFGVGNFSRMKIEDGLEVSTLNINNTEMSFDNRTYDDDILELGYCLKGSTKVTALPYNKVFVLNKGDIFIYRTLNDVEYFKFKHNNCKIISVHMNFDAIKNAINPIWEDKILLNWEKYTSYIFKGEILISEKASQPIKKVVEEIESISLDTVLDYIKLKYKTIEFMVTFFQEKSFENAQVKENDIALKAMEIIDSNLKTPPSVKELADRLNITIYKLQEEFKNATKCTVYEYIKKMRTDKAKYFLESTNMSILEVANEIGYENPSKFASAFKKYNKITPFKYRKIYKVR
nr:AraC family transcriptional regulator [Clostridium rectalis]